jgi:ABC-type nitrate/sulfonate/bicarbonate transport system permease component
MQAVVLWIKSWRPRPFFVWLALGIGIAAITDGLFHVHTWAARFSVGSLGCGFLGLFLAVFTGMSETVKDRVEAWMTLSRTIAALIFVSSFGVLGVIAVWHAKAGESVNVHTLALLSNLLPSLSAAVAIATKYNFDLQKSLRDHSAAIDQNDHEGATGSEKNGGESDQ